MFPAGLLDEPIRLTAYGGFTSAYDIYSPPFPSRSGRLERLGSDDVRLTVVYELTMLMKAGLPRYRVLRSSLWLKTARSGEVVFG